MSYPPNNSLGSGQNITRAPLDLDRQSKIIADNLLASGKE